MLKTMFKITCLALLGIAITSLAMSESSITTKGSEISKDTWLVQIKSILPASICSSFLQTPSLKNRMDELHITYDVCLSAIPYLAQSCQDQLYEQFPQTINKENANLWGRVLGECIGKEYGEKYLNR